MSEDVQPETPDVSGGEGQGEAPYGEYLERLPEEIRGDVEPVFKEWDANVTKKFQEAADFRKQWEPYQDLNLGEVPREELQNLIALRELAENDPEGFDSWLRETATERGLLGEEPTQPEAEMDSDPLDEKLSPIMSELEQLREWRDSQEYETRVSEALQVVEKQMSEYSDKHPDVPRDLVEQFLGTYAESDPENAVPLAFEAAEKFIAQVQQDMVAGKLSQPESAEQGEKVPSYPEEIRTFQEASQQVLQRLKNQ